MAALLRAWRQPDPLRPHPACHSLELPLLPLPAARRLVRLFEAALLLHAADLLLRDHWFVAAGIGLIAVGARTTWRRGAPQDAGAARRLLLAADGQLYVHGIGGATEAVTLAGESLWLGSTVLLVLQAPGRTHRLLLGPGNLDVATLATLRRRLRGAAAAPLHPAVDSRFRPPNPLRPY